MTVTWQSLKAVTWAGPPNMFHEVFGMGRQEWIKQPTGQLCRWSLKDPQRGREGKGKRRDEGSANMQTWESTRTFRGQWTSELGGREHTQVEMLRSSEMRKQAGGRWRTKERTVKTLHTQHFTLEQANVTIWYQLLFCLRRKNKSKIAASFQWYSKRMWVCDGSYSIHGNELFWVFLLFLWFFF